MSDTDDKKKLYPSPTYDPNPYNGTFLSKRGTEKTIIQEPIPEHLSKIDLFYELCWRSGIITCTRALDLDCIRFLTDYAPYDDETQHRLAGILEHCKKGGSICPHCRKHFTEIATPWCLNLILPNGKTEHFSFLFCDSCHDEFLDTDEEEFWVFHGEIVEFAREFKLGTRPSFDGINWIAVGKDIINFLKEGGL